MNKSDIKEFMIGVVIGLSLFVLIILFLDWYSQIGA